jgi:RNA polymerase sigma factor FliA
MTRQHHYYEGSRVLDRDALFNDNVELVVRIVNHLSSGLPAGIQRDDLVQVGLIALYEASKAYRDDSEAAFNTYATIRIRGSIIDELRRLNWASRSIQHSQKRLNQAISTLEQRSGRPASEREIAAELCIDLDEYQDLLCQLSGSYLLSLDDDFVDYDTADDSIPADERLHREQIIDLLAVLTDGLPQKEKLVVSLYFVEELSLKEIGMVIDVGESRVSQILTQGLSRLRVRLKNRLEMVL